MTERESWPGRVGRFMVETAVDAAGRTAMFVARDARGQNGIVKVVPRPPGTDPDPLRGERFMQEAAQLRALQHPGLVPILDAGVMDDCFYLVLQRIDGCSLAELLNEVGVVDIGTLLAIGLEVGDTLSRLHDLNVTVRDLEPANVVIDQQGRAVIAGVALSALTRLQRSQQVLGVPGYVAPELLLGLSPSPLSDQFSFGRMLLTLAGVNQPVAIDRARPLKAQLSADTVDWSRYPDDPPFVALRPIVERLTAPRAAERYPAMADALRELVEIVLQLGPEDEPEDRTMPMAPVSAPTAPTPMVSRTRSIVVASGEGLEVQVEEYEPFAETTASHRILPSLRAQAERHLASNGSRELSSHAGLPSASSGAEPATVRQRLSTDVDVDDDDDELIETVGPDQDLAALRRYAAADTVPNARLPSRRRDAIAAEVETVVPKSGPVPGTDARRRLGVERATTEPDAPVPGSDRSPTKPPAGRASDRSQTRPPAGRSEGVATRPDAPGPRASTQPDPPARRSSTRPDAAAARSSTHPDAAPALRPTPRASTGSDAPRPSPPVELKLEPDVPSSETNRPPAARPSSSDAWPDATVPTPAADPLLAVTPMPDTTAPTPAVDPRADASSESGESSPRGEPRSSPADAFAPGATGSPAEALAPKAGASLADAFAPAANAEVDAIGARSVPLAALELGSPPPAHDDFDRRATPAQGTRARAETTTDRVPPPRPPVRWALLLTTVVIAAAAVWGGRLLYAQVERAAMLPDVMPLTAKGPPRYKFYGQVPVPAQVVRRARNYYARARQALEDNRVEEAERALGICVEIADLPECHRTLAALLSLKGDAAAAAHLERYLATSPDPDLAARLPSE